MAYRRGRAEEVLPFYAIGSPTLLAGEPAEARPKKQLSREQQRSWDALYNHYEQRFTALINWRLSWWNTAGQIARYMQPHRYFRFVYGNNYEDGLRKDQAIVDRTGTICGEICAAGLMSGLTDPDRRWAKFGPGIPGFELDQAGMMWYEEIEERYYYVLAHSNFYDTQAVHFSDTVFFGTAPVIDYPDADTILDCQPICSGEYCVASSFDGKDQVLYTERRMTVNQMVGMFGLENCPEDAQKMWREKGGALEYQNVIGHAIEPNFPIAGDFDGESYGVVPGGFTWREHFWVRGRKNCAPLCTAGFHEQPFAVSLWNVRENEAYGRGVGEAMLGDVIQLQLETRQKAESIEKVNRPPMGADVSLQNLPTTTNPGKITYFNTGVNGEKKFFPLFEINPNINALTEDLNEIRERIGKTSYVDVMQPVLDLRERVTGQVTATEIDAMREERLLPLGPVFGRLHGTLRQRIRRHIAIMNRFGLIPPKPASLRGVPTKIDLISILTAAQKATATAALARSAQFGGTLYAVWPEVKYLYDIETIVRDFNEGVGASAKAIFSPRRYKQNLSQAAQQNQQAQAMAVTKEGAAAAKDLSSTSLAPGNALSALVGGGGAPGV